MRAILISVLILCAVAMLRADVPAIEFSVDTQHPRNTWSLPVFAGASPLIRVDLKQGGLGWQPSSDWTGFFWYGTNADWAATSIVRVAGTFYTNQTYVDFQCGTGTFPVAGDYYGGLVMTNATQAVEWGVGYVKVLSSGGLASLGVLDLYGFGLTVSGGLLTHSGANIGLTSNAVASVILNSAITKAVIGATNHLSLVSQTGFYGHPTPAVTLDAENGGALNGGGANILTWGNGGNATIQLSLPTSTNGFALSGSLWNSNGIPVIWTP